MLRFVVSGTPVNAAVILDPIRYREQDGTGDLYCTIPLRGYRALEADTVQSSQTGNANRSAEAEPERSDTYTVQAGDTLGAICRRFYGDFSLYGRLAAANGLMTYLGHRELQATAALPPPAEVERPELTRGEYLRLLSTARVLEKERLYLLVKVFGSTGLSVGELPRLTAEALDGRGPSPVRLPPPLAEELRGYAARQGITAGPVFRSRNGQPIRRTQVTGEIRSLCRDARVPEEKGNPRCLRRLWQETQDAIRVSVDQLVVQAFDQMMEAEQFSVGWDAGKGVGMM